MRSDAMRPRSRPEKVRPRPNDLLNIPGSDNEDVTRTAFVDCHVCVFS